MTGGNPLDSEAIRQKWDERASRYDAYYATFRGAIEHYVDWELLRRYLPESKEARILDAAGGTGRMTLPLARMGYRVTLCDISPKMLEVARQKLRSEGLLDRVEVCPCDVRKLHFPDESFDFVLCWNGGIEALAEVVRVVKKGGKISVFVVNRCRSAIDLFPQDPPAALALMESRAHDVYDEGVRYRATTAEEARELFQAQGIHVLGIYGVCGWLDVLRIPEELREAVTWDKAFFSQVVQMILKLSEEPSVKGLSRHLVLYGERAW